jgi:hypothetical protein
LWQYHCQHLLANKKKLDGFCNVVKIAALSESQSRSTIGDRATRQVKETRNKFTKPSDSSAFMVFFKWSEWISGWFDCFIFPQSIIT